MSKQTSIFRFKVFKRTVVHQGQVLDISNQPPQKRKLLKCNLKFVKHLRWSFFAKIVYFHIIFTKSSISYVWPGSNYTSEIRMTIQHYVDSFQHWYASVWFVGISLRISLAIPNDHNEKSNQKNQWRNDNTVVLRRIWRVL